MMSCSLMFLEAQATKNRSSNGFKDESCVTAQFSVVVYGLLIHIALMSVELPIGA